MVRHTKIIIIILSIFLGFEQASIAKNPPPGTGTSDVPANILIMLDNSGSMDDPMVSSPIAIRYPIDVATDSAGNIYILEYGYRRIVVSNSSGSLIRTIGYYGRGCNTFLEPLQIAIDSNDLIYVTDRDADYVKVLRTDGTCVKRIRTNAPQGIAVTDSYIYVSSNFGNEINIYNKNFKRLGYGSGKVSRTWGLAINDDETKISYANSSNNNVHEHTLSGTSITYTGSWPVNSSAASANGYVWAPYDVTYCSDDSVVVADTRNHRLQKFSGYGTFSSKTGSYSTTTAFRFPIGISKAVGDIFYVADHYNSAIRKYDCSLTLLETFGGPTKTKLDAAKKVIKRIVSDTSLTAGANFGLMEWGTRHKIRVNIDDDGAKKILSNVDGIYAAGGTKLNKALSIARDYFTSGKVPNWNLSCAKNYLIVISDGAWVSPGQVNSKAKQMRIADNIRTFAVGFGLGGSNNNYKNLAAAGIDGGTPLYAENGTELLAKLRTAIKQAISQTLTFTTPAIMTDVSKGDYIYQSTFSYETDKQWKGSLTKYKLNTDGSFGAEQWDAGDELNDKNESSRTIWTTTTGLSTTLSNNFTTSNSTLLASLIFPNKSATDSETQDLINFVRGIDTYDEDGDGNTTEARHKLGDIYHSEMVVVGPPDSGTEDNGFANFSKTDAYYRSENQYNNFKSGSTCGGPCVDRKEIILAGSNDGMLHAFDTSNGDELWAFIPPNVLGNLSGMVSSKAKSSNAIYGVDGSPIVKDIYYDDTPDNGIYDPVWKTIVLTGLGAGGHGYFALDITDVNNPKHLFAIQNDPFNTIVKHWDENAAYNDYNYEDGNINADYDYIKLGEAWSTPRIIRIKVSGKDKWVAVFAGGYNGSVNPNYGSAVFVMDLEDEGKLLKVIDIEDTAAQSYSWGGTLGSRVGGILTNNNTVLEVSKWTPDISYDSSKGESLIAEFNPPVGHTITYSNNGTISTVTKVTFDSPWPCTLGAPCVGRAKFIRHSNDIVNSIPSDLTVITANGTSVANYSGAIVYAADLEGKITKINLTDQGTLYDTTTLFNIESTSINGRYIFNKAEATINNDNNLWLYFGTGNTQKLQEQSLSILNRAYGIKDKDFPNFVSINNPGTISQCKTEPNCPGSADLGWYINLKNNQRVTAEPTIDKDRVYFPVYEPTSGNYACTTGKAILRAYNSTCGNSLLNVNLGAGVLSKVVVNKGKLYVGISGEADTKGTGFTSKDNLITAESEAKGGGTIQLEGWKENY